MTPEGSGLTGSDCMTVRILDFKFMKLCGIQVLTSLRLTLNEFKESTAYDEPAAPEPASSATGAKKPAAQKKEPTKKKEGQEGVVRTN